MMTRTACGNSGLTLPFLLLLVLGCSVGLTQPRLVAGKEFSSTTDLEKGLPETEVRDLLGDPLEIAERGDGAVEWSYFYRLRQSDKVRLLGLIPVREFSYDWERSLRIVFKNGVIASFTEEAGIVE